MLKITIPCAVCFRVMQKCDLALPTITRNKDYMKCYWTPVNNSLVVADVDSKLETEVHYRTLTSVATKDCYYLHNKSI